jgi:hypothetical protein
LPAAFLGQVCHSWVLLVDTDGVREHFDTDVLPDLLSRDPQAMADGILLAWERATDDALVIVAQTASLSRSTLEYPHWRLLALVAGDRLMYCVSCHGQPRGSHDAS